MNPAVLLELDAAVAAAFSDAALLDRQRRLAELRRRVDATAAVIAAEVYRRSRPELGHDGLAQRLGARTPAILVQHLTGTTAREATMLVRAGTHITTPAGAPWLRAVSAALAAGDISLEAFETIRAGLGAPDDHITAADLTDAATTLLTRAPTITIERLAADARDLRAELDLNRVADTEHALRERRYLHLTRQTDGMTRLTGLLDPESAATVTTAIDAATSPRRGGPRFIDPAAAATAERLTCDPRTTEQIALDALVELIRIGTAVDDHILLGTGRTVNLHVNAGDLHHGRGIARIEGQHTPISIDTAQRHTCDAGTIPILFDTDAQVINIGREHRHFTHRQRQGLAARDGGCRFPHCQRPPSWTEAHHITQWHTGGHTNIDNGILLCRHHHLLIHNNGWRIDRHAEPNTWSCPRPNARPAPDARSRHPPRVACTA